MEDLFDIGYVVFIILLFLFSFLRNIGKKKKKAPPARPQPRASRPPQREGETPADVFKKELAKFLGLAEEQPEKPPPPTPKPRLTTQTPPTTFKPVKTPASMPESISEQPSAEYPVKPVKPRFISLQRKSRESIRERIIWAEILGPPKSRRRGRTI